MIYILLPIYNRKTITLKFVDCLLKQTYTNFKLILIDDGNDGTDNEVLKRLPETIVIKGNGNLWWAGALQKGYEWLANADLNDQDIVLLINDDTTFKEDFLENAVDVLHSYPDKTIIKALSVDIDSGETGDGLLFYNYKKLKFENPESENSREGNCTATRGLFLFARDFFSIGGFIPHKLPHYLSDYEYTYRAYKQGFRLATDEKLYLYADFKTTGVQGVKSYTFPKLIRILFSKRNTSNPVYWFNFILLTTEKKVYIVRNIILVCLWTINNLLNSIIVSILKFFGIKHQAS